MLKVSDKKKLEAALRTSGRQRISDEQVEAAALVLIEGKKTITELSEKLQVSAQTLRKRMNALIAPEEQAQAAE